MKTGIQTLCLFVLGILFWACESTPGGSESTYEINYVVNDESAKGVEGDSSILAIHVDAITEKGDTMRTTRIQTTPMFMPAAGAVFSDALRGSHVGDSLTIFIPVDSILKGDLKNNPPEVLIGVKKVRHEIKVVDIYNSREEFSEAQQGFRLERRKRIEESMKIYAAAQDSLLQEYFKEKGLTDYVQKTEEGVYYMMKEDGKGDLIQKFDTVQVQYSGYFIDKEAPFDTSQGTTKPFVFPVGTGSVIKGWDIALTLMKPNSRIRVFIPAQYAYGRRGKAPKVGPDKPLIFDIGVVKYFPYKGDQVVSE